MQVSSRIVWQANEKLWIPTSTTFTMPFDTWKSSEVRSMKLTPLGRMVIFHVRVAKIGFHWRDAAFKG